MSCAQNGVFVFDLLEKILEGNIIQEEYDNKIKFIGFSSICNSNIGYINNYNKYYRLVNNTESVAVSLHIYSPPNFVATLY